MLAAVAGLIVGAQLVVTYAWEPFVNRTDPWHWRVPSQTVRWGSSDIPDAGTGPCNNVLPAGSRGDIREAARRWTWPANEESASIWPLFFLNETGDMAQAHVNVTCAWADSNTVASVQNTNYNSLNKEVYGQIFIFNNSGAFRFTRDRTVGSNWADVLVTSVHELGHVAMAGDNRDNSSDIMYYQLGSYKYNPNENDRRASSYNQGFASEPEPYAPRGPQRTPARDWWDYELAVDNWSCQDNTPQETWYEPWSPGLPTPKDGGYYHYVSGCARDGLHSYAYSILYDTEILIKRGLTLEWWQYNLQAGTGQYQMSIDLKLVDDYGNVSWLRDTGISDKRGFRVHPALRPNTMNDWYYSEVDLSSLEGKRIVGIYGAYDNGYNWSWKTGQYNAWIENLALWYK